MLIKLDEYQVSKYWPFLKEKIIEGFGDPRYNRPEVAFNVLRMALFKDIDVWAAGDGDDLYGVLTTMITVNPFTREKEMVITTVWSNGRAMLKDFIDSVEHLSKYAKSKGCTRLIATVKNKLFAEKVKKTGFKPEMVYMVKEV